MKTLLDIEDDLTATKGFVVAAFLTCEHAMQKGPHRSAACSVINEAWERLDGIIDSVRQLRGAPTEEASDAD
ncbi:MAG: hypothetical protein ABSA13_02930 [Beijerinckiaceae bacterium]|jgi:hypothetical protein